MASSHFLSREKNFPVKTLKQDFPTRSRHNPDTIPTHFRPADTHIALQTVVEQGQCRTGHLVVLAEQEGSIFFLTAAVS